MALTNCETCVFYEYDEFWDCYVCSVNLDEDDMNRFLQGKSFECSYWQSNNEYEIVKKQN